MSTKTCEATIAKSLFAPNIPLGPNDLLAEMIITWFSTVPSTSQFSLMAFLRAGFAAQPLVQLLLRNQTHSI
eukprot:m.274875 g.274875  ORF g.274875 m.274875 type:complete len:72 (-) comp72164_c0_seq1:33-248(-)